MGQLSTFLIFLQGRAFGPATVKSEVLLVGSDGDCNLPLDDPTIPAKAATIRERDSHFYIASVGRSPFAVEGDSKITLNGRALIGETALAADDVLVIGGCSLRVNKGKPGELLIAVAYPDPTAIAAKPVSDQSGRTIPTGTGAHNPKATVAVQSGAADVDMALVNRHPWRGQRKVGRPNYLEPTPLKVDGPGFNWSPTKDLAPAWPVWLLICFVLIGAAVAAVAFFKAPSIFAPGKGSKAHTTAVPSMSPAIALAATGNSCRVCHRLKGTIDQNCSNCHQANGFHASTIRQHAAAGITCISCHTEHRGTDFSPKVFAFSSCATCHNDNNKQTYNGKTVHTPHGGSFGYPVSGGQWIWAGLDEEALRLKPEVVETRQTGDTEKQWRSKQFHAIHLLRVKVAPGVRDVRDGVLQCSSCHNGFAPIDRETPRQTCSKCHNGYVDSRTSTIFVAAGQPNCTSCHVQHYYDLHRWGDLLTEPDKRLKAIDKNYIDAVRSTASH
jgi:hypothetical protein